MSAGLNLVGRIWRLTTPLDDSVGGAVPTGTILYEPVFSRIYAEKSTIALLEQGLEVPTIFKAQLSYTAFSVTGTFDVQQNDQYEITWPPISNHYQKKFVIISVQPPSFNDPRHYLQVNLRRLVIANSNNLQ